MKNLIVLIGTFLFLFTGCNSESPDIPQEKEEEKKEVITEWDPSLLITKENPEAKKQLVGLWYMIYDGWGEDPNIKDKNDYGPIRTVEFSPNGEYLLYRNYPEQYAHHTFTITDDYFYFYSIPYNEEGCIDHGLGVWIYNYEFYDDKLRLKIAWGLIASEGAEYIFKRIEEE